MQIFLKQWIGESDCYHIFWFPICKLTPSR